MLAGDAVAKVATPIARMFGAGCIDPETNDLRPESPCAQRKRMLNNGRYAEAIWDFLFHKKQNEIMTYIVTKQVKVEAETPEEAVAKATQGETIALTVNPRPTPPQSLQNAQQRVLPAAARPITGTPQATA